MAISTTSTVDDVFYSYLIEPMILSAASEHAQLSPLARQFDRTEPHLSVAGPGGEERHLRSIFVAQRR